VDTSLPAARVIRALEQPKEEQSPPNQIRIDNGPEPIATEFYDSCRDHDIDVAYRQPLDGFVERFNGSFRRVFWMHTCLKPEPKLEQWLGNG